MLNANDCRTCQYIFDRHMKYLNPMLAIRLASLYGNRKNPIVDMGTGPAYLAAELATRVDAKIIGVDINPAMLELAAEHLARQGLRERVELDLQDVHALPYPDGFAGMVYSFSCMHHWADPVRALRECYRILSPGGVLVLFDPLSDSSGRVIPFFRNTFAEPEVAALLIKAVRESYSFEQVHALAREAGLGDYALRPFAFSEAEIVECLDLLDQSPYKGQSPDNTETSWILTTTKQEGVRI